MIRQLAVLVAVLSTVASAQEYASRARVSGGPSGGGGTMTACASCQLTGTTALKDTGTNLITSATSAASATTTVGAFTLKPTATLGANDLVLDVQSAAAAHLLTVDLEGDAVIAGGLTTGTTGITIGTTGANVGLTFNISSGIYFGAGAGRLYGDGSGNLTYTGTSIYATGPIDSATGFRVSAGVTFSAAAPTVTSACTSPTITHGTATSFQADVGSSCTAVTTIVLGLPSALNGWGCSGYNKTTSTVTLEQTADTASSATLINTGKTTGLAVDFVDGADLVINCVGR